MTITRKRKIATNRLPKDEEAPEEKQDMHMHMNKGPIYANETMSSIGNDTTISTISTATATTPLVDSISSNVFLHVLLPMLSSAKDIIHLFLTTQHIYVQFYAHYEISQCVKWNAKTTECFALMEENEHSTPIVRCISYNSSEPIVEGMLPSTIQEIRYNRDTNVFEEPNALPSNLKILKLGPKFTDEIPKKVIPKSVEVLELGYYYSIDNKTLPKMITPSLKKLKMGLNANVQLRRNLLPSTLEFLDLGADQGSKFAAGFLPSNLKTLIFGSYFNDIVTSDVLPSRLEEIVYGKQFNQPIAEHFFPTNLKHLRFGKAFNQPIKPNVLPPSLETLVFGSHFNQPLEDHVLPASLKSLTFTNHFNHPLRQNVLPSSLVELFLESTTYVHAIHVGVFPRSLKILKLDYLGPALLPGTLPESLIKLELNHYRHPLQQGVLPSRLKHLILRGLHHSLPERVLPESLSILEIEPLNDDFVLESGVLPSKLEVFEQLHRTFRGRIAMNAFPSSIRRITFTSGFNQAFVCGFFPEGLKVLELGHRFNRPLSIDIFPSTLKILRFGVIFKQPLQANVFPAGLELLAFENTEILPIQIDVLPSTLQVLEINPLYKRKNISQVIPLNCIVEYSNKSIPFRYTPV